MRYPWAAAFLIDALLVIVFSWIGLVQHHGGATLPALAETAWPFLVAMAIGWVVSLAWRAPAKPLRVGLPVWAITVAVGMVLRALAGGGTAAPFVIVAAVTLLLFLVGWRTVAALIRLRARRSSRRP